MEKFILIDGNSLLNRAYYAMGVFSTKEGLPTNGIFGFVKLIFKILEERKPKYFAVTFDLRAPTFRHKMYDGYKSTRKPMPEDLARQVPILKELLTSMNIRIVEKEGFEADDLIGSLSRKFNGVDVYIYTGDRDSYQLVDDNVSVCFTRRGVSDIDLLTKKNFYEKVKLEPLQIIEEKALMGDSSDNIPGVKGVGAKTALELLQKYNNLDEIYKHINELPNGLRGKLEGDREIAYLSRTLATIDTNVPLDVTLDSCEIQIPFSEAARESFQRLEFRSLLNTDFFEKQTSKTQYSLCVHPEDILPLLNGVHEFSFCTEKEGYHLYFAGKEFCFPFRENILVEGVFPDDMKPLLKELFSNSRVALVTDVKATVRFLEGLGIKADCLLEDVMLLRYLGNSDLRPVDPKELTKECSLPETECAYALKLTYDDALKKMNGTAEEKLYRELELPLAYILLDMENEGVCVDEDKFSFFREKFYAELKELSEKIFALAGESFNLNSPFKLSEILFEKLGYNSKGLKKNIRGGYSTNAEVLEKLAEEHEIARLILRYREIQKLVSTYVDGIAPLVKRGIVHTTYNQTMTTTGRLSSTNPNLQNIPVQTEEGKELRKLFVAHKDNVLIDADYSQIELRLLAHFSGSERLIKAYNERADIHSETASQVFGIKEVTPQMRRAAKVINFGIIYGMGAFALSKDLNCSVAEAQAYIERYFNPYPEVKTYMDENIRRAKEEGFVMTILGRRRYITELKSPNMNIRAFGERAARNMPLQGSAADIIKIAMIRVFNRLKEEGLQAKMVLQVHDELMLDCPLEEKEQATKILKEEMENAVNLKVPLTVDISTGKSWYEAK